jgi:hypothetical protein
MRPSITHDSLRARTGSARFEFRDDLLPISLLIAKQTLTASDIGPVFEHYRGFCRRGIRFVAISDVRAACDMPDAKTRAEFGEATAQFVVEAKAWSLGAAMVVDSSLVRSALVAIDWIARPRQRTRYFTNLPDAIEWACQRLESAGIPLTQAIRDHRNKGT